jgi:hypothetical protein
VLVDLIRDFIEDCLIVALLQGRVDEFAVGDVHEFFRAVHNQRPRVESERHCHVIILLPLVARGFSLEEGDDAADGRDEYPRHFTLQAECGVAAQTETAEDGPAELVPQPHRPGQHQPHVLLVTAELLLALPVPGVVVGQEGHAVLHRHRVGKIVDVVER